ncbi:hypothetical protein POM88_047420 [Heracleum sosnowskyi]|uniref:5MP1/2-like HEAT domain-containing protein n=1 Tax=Heracleum sosnowskyi TaxID=360622 RepID=A0AAD8GTV4_9APIA|nr:hypothetical protein POM88_047420 [Heracleum sosnowskyi]
MIAEMLTCFGFGQCKRKPLDPFTCLTVKVDPSTSRKILKKMWKIENCSVKTCGEDMVLITGVFNPNRLLKAIKPENLLSYKVGGCSEILDTSGFEKRQKHKQDVKDYKQEIKDRVEMQAHCLDYYHKYVGGYGQSYGQGYSYGDPYVRNYGHPQYLQHASTRIKTRKRNIAAPLDPAAFADAVVQIFLDNAGDLELIARSLESSDLNFSRYGDTFFEVVFTGGCTQPGTTKSDEGERHPYLFLQSLELFEENERKKLAIFTALAFSQKLSGLPPETVFQPLLKDNLVGKGLVLSFITDFFKEYLIDNSLDDLIAILKRGKMEDNLLEFFPSAKRSPEAFSQHFTKAGIAPLVEYNEKKIFEVKLKEMKSALTTQIAEEADISEIIESVKQHVKDAKLPDIEVVRILWDVMMDAVQWSGKNQQQNANLALRQHITKHPPPPPLSITLTPPPLSYLLRFSGDENVSQSFVEASLSPSTSTKVLGVINHPRGHKEVTRVTNSKNISVNLGSGYLPTALAHVELNHKSASFIRAIVHYHSLI